MASPDYTLYHSSGMGSTFTLALLRLFNVPHVVKSIDMDFGLHGVKFKDEESQAAYVEMKQLNPLAQFPTLVKVEGEDKVVLTEMAAIALYLHDKYAAGTTWSTASLTDTQLAMFYRLLVFIPANIYPLITIIDFPERYISVPRSSLTPAKEATSWVKDKGRHNLQATFLTLERLLGSPTSAYSLGTASPTLIDIYISLVSHYAPRPRNTWLETNCPRVHACALETLKHPVLKKVFLEQDLETHLAEA